MVMTGSWCMTLVKIAIFWEIPRDHAGYIDSIIHKPTMVPTIIWDNGGLDGDSFDEYWDHEIIWNIYLIIWG